MRRIDELLIPEGLDAQELADRLLFDDWEVEWLVRVVELINRAMSMSACDECLGPYAGWLSEEDREFVMRQQALLATGAYDVAGAERLFDLTEQAGRRVAEQVTWGR